MCVCAVVTIWTQSIYNKAYNLQLWTTGFPLRLQLHCSFKRISLVTKSMVTLFAILLLNKGLCHFLFFKSIDCTNMHDGLFYTVGARVSMEMDVASSSEILWGRRGRNKYIRLGSAMRYILGPMSKLWNYFSIFWSSKLVLNRKSKVHKILKNSKTGNFWEFFGLTYLGMTKQEIKRIKSRWYEMLRKLRSYCLWLRLDCKECQEHDSTAVFFCENCG